MDFLNQPEDSKLQLKCLLSKRVSNLDQEEEEEEEIEADNVCYNHQKGERENGLNDLSFDVEESGQNEGDKSQQAFIENLNQQQYFKIDHKDQKQKCYGIGGFIQEEEQEHDLSSVDELTERHHDILLEEDEEEQIAEVAEEAAPQQNKSVNTEITQNNQIQEEDISTNPQYQESNDNQKDQTTKANHIVVVKEYEKHLTDELDQLRQAHEESDLRLNLARAAELLKNQSSIQPSDNLESLVQSISSIPYFQHIQDSEYANQQNEFIKFCEHLTETRVSKNEFLFHFNDDVDYVYILLQGFMAVFVPKSEHDIDEEINLELDILSEEKRIQSIQVEEQQPSALQSPQQALLHLHKKLLFSQYQEEFLSNAYQNFSKENPMQQNDFRRSHVIQPGEVFGQLAMEREMKRTASVIAMTDCVLAKIEGWKYAKFLKREKDIRQLLQKSLKQFIQNNQDKNNTLERLSYLFVETPLQRNQIIYKMNDKQDALYFVLRGTVEMLKLIKEEEGPTPKFSNRLDKLIEKQARQYSQTRNVCAYVLSPGEFFGQEDLFEERPRTYTAQSTSCETIILSLKKSILYEMNSPAIIKSLKELGEQRIKRCEDRLMQIQQFKQDITSFKLPQIEQTQDLSNKANRNIQQNSFSYLRFRKDLEENSIETQNPLLNQDAQINSDQIKKKRAILGEVLDVYQFNQKGERDRAKLSQGQTFYLKNKKPDSITDFDSCMRYIKTVPSFCQLRPKQNLPSLKESLQIFEEEKLKLKAEQYQQIKKMKRNRKCSIQQSIKCNGGREEGKEEDQVNINRSRSYSFIEVNSQNVNVIENSKQSNDNQQSSLQTIENSPCSISQIQSIKKNGDKRQQFTPLVIKSLQQLNADLFKNVGSSNSVKSQDNSSQLKSSSQQHLQSPKYSQESNNKSLSLQNLYIVNKMGESKRSDFEDILHQNSQIFLKRRHNSLNNLNFLSTKAKGALQQKKQLPRIIKESQKQVIELNINQEYHNEQNNKTTQTDNQKQTKDYQYQCSSLPNIYSQNQQNQVQLDYTPVSIGIDQNSQIFDPISNSQVNLNIEKPVQLIQSNEQLLISLQQLSAIKQMQEPIQQNGIKSEQNINQKSSIRKEDKQSIYKNKQQYERALIGQLFQSRRRRNLSEGHIQQKIDELAALLSTQSSPNEKLLSQQAKLIKNGKSTQDVTSSSTSTNDIHQYYQIYSPISCTYKNDTSLNNNNKIFAEDSFTIQSYKSIASNSKLKSKILHLPVVDEGAIQKQDINSYTKTISTAQSKESIDQNFEPRYIQKNSSITPRSHMNVLCKSPKNYLPQKPLVFSNIMIQENNIQNEVKKQLKTKQPNSLKHLQPFIQSIIFPDFKYTNPLYAKVKGNPINNQIQQKALS